LNILLEKLDSSDLQDPNGSNFNQSKMAWDDRDSFTCILSEGQPSRLRFVIAASRPFSDRLMIMKIDRPWSPQRILPLRSQRDEIEKERTEPIDLSSLRLISAYFVTADERWNRVDLNADGLQCTIQQDRNHPSFNPFGDVESSTLMGIRTEPVELSELQTDDPTGQGRRLFRFTWDTLSPLEATLVLHPQQGGDHRLLLRDEGELLYIVPMRHARL
jgi:hypothetical protein